MGTREPRNRDNGSEWRLGFNSVLFSLYFSNLNLKYKIDKNGYNPFCDETLQLLLINPERTGGGGGGGAVDGGRIAPPPP